MKRMLAVSVIMLCFPLAAFLWAEDSITVSFEEIGRRVVVLGRFKEPLGTILTIEGYSKGRMKYKLDPMFDFVVLKVNGKTLNKPIEIEQQREASVPGKRYRLTGYEWGEFAGAPPGAAVYGEKFQTTGGWLFIVRFSVFKAEEVAQK